MHYLELEDIKRQLNIDESYTDDDVYLEFLGDAAEAAVCEYLNRDLCDLFTGEERVEPIFQCMLMLVADLYNNRESNITGVSITKNPTFELLLSIYKEY
jgi:hypothetical protein